MNATSLTSTLKRNLGILHREADQISDAQALKQVGQGSSANWVVGHILATRTRLLDMLHTSVDGLDPEKIRALYGTKTHPDASTAMPLSELLRLLDATQAALQPALAEADLTPLVQSPFGEMPLGELINFFAWHEGYHAGQLVILRHWLND